MEAAEEVGEVEEAEAEEGGEDAIPGGRRDSSQDAERRRKAKERARVVGSAKRPSQAS